MTIQEAMKSGKEFKVVGESESCWRKLDKFSGLVHFVEDNEIVPLSLVHFDDKISWEVKQ